MKNKKVTSKVCILIILWIASLQGQFKEFHGDKYKLSVSTGNLYSDFVLRTEKNVYSSGFDTVASTSVNKSYSPLRAGLYSAIMPGAGQFYTKSYWQSTLFLSAEVLMWIFYSTYEKKGDRQTNDFQNYADARWSVVRYVEWIRSNFPNEASGVNFYIPNTQGLPPWEQIDWARLNAVEDQIGQLATSGQLTGFSHELPHRPEQQYYELIGKYPQFGGGWDDATSFTPADVLASNVSPNFLKYSRMRGDANSFYNIASTFSYMVVANHIFSALEAAWNASRLNRKIHLQGHIRSRIVNGIMVEFVPTVDLKVNL